LKEEIVGFSAASRFIISQLILQVHLDWLAEKRVDLANGEAKFVPNFPLAFAEKEGVGKKNFLLREKKKKKILNLPLKQNDCIETGDDNWWDNSKFATELKNVGPRIFNFLSFPDAPDNLDEVLTEDEVEKEHLWDDGSYTWEPKESFIDKSSEGIVDQVCEAYETFVLQIVEQ